MDVTFQCHKEKHEKGGFPSEMQTFAFQLQVYILAIAKAEKYFHSRAHFAAWSAKHPVNASNEQLIISALYDGEDLTYNFLGFFSLSAGIK